MRKHDYEILAAAIKKHRESAIGYAAQAGVPEKDCEAAQCAEAIARTFARFAHVNSVAFLKACGL